ncbi:MAG: ATP-binding protein [Deltaproteobacteria bacterium]|nr:ATP-binding protein [Deltaproteobacteria bacterium]
MLPTLFDLCTPRPDVLQGLIRESDYAADLGTVARNEGLEDYRVAAKFFANTYATQGLKTLLDSVLRRLSGTGGEASAIFRLDTQFGGGKTHALIALVHAAHGMRGVANPEQFVSPAIVPAEPVRVAAFDGQDADPANGRKLEHGLRAYTPWGEIAYALNGRAGFDVVKESDRLRVAPGTDTLRELMGDKPCLFVLDELALFLREAEQISGLQGQLAVFLQNLLKAVQSTPRCAAVFTLALGKDGTAHDAYAKEQKALAKHFNVHASMGEAQSVAARVATLIDPTTEDETALVLRHRLFERVDLASAAHVVEAYRQLWWEHRTALPAVRVGEDQAAGFTASYPFHPALLQVLTEKLGTLQTFHRVRGMLRLLAGAIQALWEQQPKATYAIHANHVDLGAYRVHAEIITRLEQSAFVPALRRDVVAAELGPKALAQQLDATQYAGLAPYATFVARTVFLHTLAFNKDLKGCTPEELALCVLAPGSDISFLNDACRRFRAQSAFLDDVPGAPLRFLVDANLTQIVAKEASGIADQDVAVELNARIQEVFANPTVAPCLDLVTFPAGPGEVLDGAGNGRPHLVVLHFDAATTASHSPVTVPALVERLFRFSNDAGSFRQLQNNLCFLVAADGKIEAMRQAVRQQLALVRLCTEETLGQLAPHQRAKIKANLEGAPALVAIAIQQAYCHLFYPSKLRLQGASVDLNHAVFTVPETSEAPGNGQKQVVLALRNAAGKKLRTDDDQPDSPTYVRDRTPLKKGAISTHMLRREFRADVALPMLGPGNDLLNHFLGPFACSVGRQLADQRSDSRLRPDVRVIDLLFSSPLVGDGVFKRGVQGGVDMGEYVYVSGSMVIGKGNPPFAVAVDDSSFIYTMAYAMQNAIWPPQATAPPVQPPAVDGSAPPAGGGESGVGDTGGQGHAGTTVPPVDPTDGSTDSSKGAGLVVEGTLRDALIQMWAKCRQANWPAIRELNITAYAATDGFKLLAAVQLVQAAKRSASLVARYETATGGQCGVDFQGAVDEALAVRDFLAVQLRAAEAGGKTVEFTGQYTLSYAAGLSLAGEEPENLTAQLTRIANGQTFVQAFAVEGKP